MGYRAKSYRRKKKSRPILLFIIISILLHILIIFLISNKSDIFLPKIKKAEQKDDDFIEISEIPVPKEKETEPPEKTKRFADRSRKVEKEKTRDDFTKQGAVSPNTPNTTVPRPPTPQTQQAQEKKAQEKQTAKVEEKVEKVEKKSEHKVAKREPEEVKTPKVPKYKRSDFDLRDKTKDKTAQNTQQNKDSRQQNFQTAQNPFLFPQANSPDFRGLRNLPKEDTVDWNTTEYKYLSYFLKLKRQIEGVWNYPKASKLSGEQGELLLIFTLSSNGTLEDVKLLQTSGYSRLDNEALRAIKVAAPYFPFPKAWDLERLNVKAGFVYRFGGWQFRR